VQLVVAEKPSVARDLARVLGVAPSGKHAFEGRDHVITWCIGHLVELEEPAAYDARWKTWRMDTLPMLPEPFRLRGAKHALPQLSAVGTLLRERRMTSVVNACDAGREGELIFRYVYDFAHARLPIRRLWISSLTDEAIRRGFSALRPGLDFDPLADAAQSRSEADWLVGMNATRAVTLRGRSSGHDSLLSIGRVQTPTLAMLVERERLIRDFVPREYWEVRADLATPSGDRFTATWRAGKTNRLGTQVLADELVARDTAGPAPVVERVDAKTVREPPPLLFDLTTLQRTANRRYGFSAARTLELAQALYERHKVLTYPRTDSRHLTHDILPELPAVLDALATRAEYAPFVDAARTRPPLGKRFVDDSKVSDHHAIIPTAKRPGALGTDEQKLYDLVARRFLAAHFPDAELATTEVWVRVGAPAPIAPVPSDQDAQTILDALPLMPDRYVARGRVRISAGWQDVAGIDAKSAAKARDGEEAVPVLPKLVVGDQLAGRFASKSKHTTPPPRFTEATLLSAMESAGKSITDEELRDAMKERGLGTPATRASIIETLLQRKYIERARQDLVPTPTGISLIENLPDPSLASPSLTGSWEARLARIARGHDTRAAFMADIAAYVTAMVDAIRGGSSPASPPPRSSMSPPPRSSMSPPPRSSMSPPLSDSRSSRGNGMASQPARAKTAKPKRAAKSASAKSASAKSASTKSASAKSASAKSASVKLEPGTLACPRCGTGSVITGSRGWGCTRWREGCRFVVWFETAGRRLSAAQLRDLVLRGRTRTTTFELDGVARTGKLVLDYANEQSGARFEPE
jgi:DNA topoisomerase-3